MVSDFTGTSVAFAKSAASAATRYTATVASSPTVMNEEPPVVTSEEMPSVMPSVREKPSIET